MDTPPLTVGIEEEYFLVDLETRDLAFEPPQDLFDACVAELGDQVTNEYLMSQIEVGTKPHRSVPDAVAELAAMRGCIADIAGHYGLAPIAASTHPFAQHRKARRTRKDRYEGLHRDLGATVDRLQICGCHVHVGVGDGDLRIDLMNQAAYFLPHLLALSTSSPYWEGNDTGLMSYRLTVFDALPRTGIPDRFESQAEYDRVVSALVSAGGMEDGTKIWWDIRPSARFPTLEMRIADVCTRVADVGSVAAMYQSILSLLWRLKTMNQRWRIYPRILVQENRWRAMRYGTTGDLVDFGKGERVAYPALVDELVDLLAAEADALGCRAQVEHARAIAAEGTSATRQRAAHDRAVAAGADADGAMRAVVDHLIAETRAQP